jgi:PAS domain S-box-containing protein
MRLEADSLMRVMENLHDGLYLTDMNRVIIFWNRAAETITGYPASAVVGSSCANGILIHVDSDGHLLCKGICPLAATIADGKPRETEVCLRHRNGHRVPVSVRVTPLTDAKGRIVGGIELFTDISGQEAAKERLRELEQIAMVDTLTKLANRRYIEQELSNRFEEYRRFRVPFGILFMDIDHFKKVNDVYGHDAGDEVLKLVARTFTANARPLRPLRPLGRRGICGHPQERERPRTRVHREPDPRLSGELGGHRERRSVVGDHLDGRGAGPRRRHHRDPDEACGFPAVQE